MRRIPHYPAGTVHALLASDLVTPQTRAVLSARLDRPDVRAPRFFDVAAFEVLRAICARLLPQDDFPRPVDLAGLIDDRLAAGEGDGWRYAQMPPDGEAYVRGLHAVQAMAVARGARTFSELSPDARDELLAAVQAGEVPPASWTDVSPQRFFEELLAEVSEGFYSHPFGLDEIGYAGMADAQGWQAIGLDALAPHEPRERERGAR